MAIEAIEAIGEEGPARSSGAFSCSEGERGAGGGREAGISSLSQQAKKQKRSKPASPTQPSKYRQHRPAQPDVRAEVKPSLVEPCEDAAVGLAPILVVQPAIPFLPPRLRLLLLDLRSRVAGR